MHGISPHDHVRAIDWGRTSGDYAEWRPDYPPEFYERLAALGVGQPGQRILDLGTGVGFLARNFARRGVDVVGIDISEEQIAEARHRAAAEGLPVEFRVAPAEETGLPDAAFDVITASQCWLYFDRERAIREVRRLLQPGGVLVTSHFCWLPRENAIARASEAMVLRHNPDWTAADWAGAIPPIPKWAEGRFRLAGMFVFDVTFRSRTRAGAGGCGRVAAWGRRSARTRWRGLIASTRSCCGRLRRRSSVRHRIDAHVLQAEPAASRVADG